MQVSWHIIVPAEPLKERFFRLTKHIHNAIHDAAPELEAAEWLDDLAPLSPRPPLEGSAADAGAKGAAEAAPDAPQHHYLPSAVAAAAAAAKRIATAREIFERVCDGAVHDFFTRVAPDASPENTVILIHDPQPLAMGRGFSARNIPWIGRFHIGLDFETSATASAWRFLSD
jgi:glycosyltransferase involved in cell wall biosynthesis